MFEIHFISPVLVAFRSSHSKWLCAEPSGMSLFLSFSSPPNSLLSLSSSLPLAIFSSLIVCCCFYSPQDVHVTEKERTNHYTFSILFTLFSSDFSYSISIVSPLYCLLSLPLCYVSSHDTSLRLLLHLTSGHVVCDREYRADWEAFTMCVAPQGKFAFKSHNSKFLTSKQDGYPSPSLPLSPYSPQYQLSPHLSTLPLFIFLFLCINGICLF